MTRKQMISTLRGMSFGTVIGSKGDEALRMAISALEQEPCELLILKSDILLHQDDRKKWAESMEREKAKGLIILPPYFTPLLVPNDVEIRIEQEPCKDAINREAVNMLYDKWRPRLATHVSEFGDELKKLPPVTPSRRKGHWIRFEDDKCYWYGCSECKHEIPKNEWGYDDFSAFCPNCGAEMESE